MHVPHTTVIGPPAENISPPFGYKTWINVGEVAPQFIRREFGLGCGGFGFIGGGVGGLFGGIIGGGVCGLFGVFGVLGILGVLGVLGIFGLLGGVFGGTDAPEVLVFELELELELELFEALEFDGEFTPEFNIEFVLARLFNI